MPKGHSTLEPRIDALEAALVTLTRRLDQMQEAFNRGVIPSPKPYESQFRVFPGANPNSNGS